MDFFKSIVGWPWLIAGGILLALPFLVGGNLGTVGLVLGLVILFVLAINTASYGWGKGY